MVIRQFLRQEWCVLLPNTKTELDAVVIETDTFQKTRLILCNVYRDMHHNTDDGQIMYEEQVYESVQIKDMNVYNPQEKTK